MADTPDDMRNLFAAIDKQGGDLDIFTQRATRHGRAGFNPNRDGTGGSGRVFLQ